MKFLLFTKISELSMTDNQLHNITAFFNLVSFHALHVGVITLIFSNVKFKTQTAEVIFQIPSSKYQFT